MLQSPEAPTHNRDAPAMTTPAVAGFVTLTTPLPCTIRLSDGHLSDGHGMTGFVRALATDRLQVTLTTPSKLPALGECRLSLALPEGRTYDFDGQIETIPAGSDTAVLRIDTPASGAQLIDLLHLLRKEQHIHICATMDVEASDRYTGFSDLVLQPRALPELSWDELSTEAQFLGQTFRYPLLITGMTGGIERGAEINRRLAAAAAHFGVPMGVGSQRLALENPQHAAIFAVKRTTPNVYLIGNLGFAQLRGRSLSAALDDCKRAVAMIEADALAIHVNVLQEVVQVEGDRDFRGAYTMLGGIAQKLDVPLLVKEVGSGMDTATAKRLAECGVRAIDVGGKGGTSWSFIEGARASDHSTQHVAQSFRDWGIPTAIALYHLRTVLGHQADIVATGGVRDGLTVAKAVAQGASMVGIGLPLFRAALASETGPHDVLHEFVKGLKTAMMVSGSCQLSALAARLRILPRFLQHAEAYAP